ncbi:hypothetical protein ACHAW6_002568 [Cyclotella cf. meneghiniana]
MPRTILPCASILLLLLRPASSFPSQPRPPPAATRSNAPDDIPAHYFATCPPGLHAVLTSELLSLGALDARPAGTAGVSFRGTSATGLKCLLWCRTAHRILQRIASSDDDNDDEEHVYSRRGIRNGEELYRFVRTAVRAPSLLGDGRGGLHTLSVSAIYASRVPRELCHGRFTALTVKNALVDDVRESREDGRRPDVDAEDADVPLVVVLRGRRADGRRRRRGDDEFLRRGRGGEEEELVADVDIYRCLHSGGSLHRRGYRTDSIRDDGHDDTWSNSSADKNNGSALIHRAAMKESLAAGLLLHAGWDKLVRAARSDGKGAVLVDPMTGSATLPVEAALIACDVAPGLMRMVAWKKGGGDARGRNPHRFPPAVRWKDFCEASVWEELLVDAARRAKSGVDWAKKNGVSILCNEKDSRAIALARTSIRNSGVGSIISLTEGDCLDWKLHNKVIEGRTIFACNPPWGVRLTEDIDDSWVSLREFLRREGNGAEAWVLSGNKDLTKILRMKKSRSVVVRTADEDLRWLQYHIFQKSEAPVL